MYYIYFELNGVPLSIGVKSTDDNLRIIPGWVHIARDIWDRLSVSFEMVSSRP